MSCRALSVVVLCLSIISAPVHMRAQSIFETSREVVDNPDLAINDGGGLLRGGVNFRPLLPERGGEVVFRGNARSGSLCGFNVLASFAEQFEQIPDIMMQLLEPILLGIPLILLCQTFPSFCDIIKHLHQYVNVTLRARYARCQDVMLAAMTTGVAMRNDAMGACLRQRVAAGEALNGAWDACVEGPGFLPAPNGRLAEAFNLIETILVSSGADPAFAERIADMTGDIRLQSNGSMFQAEHTAPKERVIETYLVRQDELVESLGAVISSMAGGAEPDQEALRALIVYGTPISVDALTAIAAEPDPALRAYEIQKLAGNIALAQTVSDIYELGAILEKSITVSKRTPQQRQEARNIHAALLSEVTRLQGMKKIIDENVVPNVEALLKKRARQQIEVAVVMRQAASSQQIPSRFESGQSALGYRQ
jgi:hypothetical protein